MTIMGSLLLPPPLAVDAKERHEGLNTTLILGEGWGYTRGGDRYVHCAKKGPFY